jgi:hypothetical protein
MAQYVINLSDESLFPKIKEAIRSIVGEKVKIEPIHFEQSMEKPNTTTLRAMEEMDRGEYLVCEDYEDYLRKVKNL